VNGQALADTDNMYRTWEFDVKKLLHAGRNQIRITFTPIQPYIEAFQKRAPKVPNATGIDISNIRKSPYMNSWDFCARFLPCGIYRPISLIAYNTARIGDIRIDQDLKDPKVAHLAVAVLAESIGTPQLEARVVVRYKGKVVSRQHAAFTGDRATVPLDIPHPRLWWPNGMGDHPLYTVSVEVRDHAGRVIDASERRIGLRTLELLPKTDQRPLRLAVNGLEIYAKGADWIPLDVFPSRVTPEKIARYIDDAVAVNMNMLRVWGGGYYPEDAFFDACDEKGILVWSEFCFACAPYPGNNPEFVENIRAEVADQVRRLRHHPAVAVWCGNNEVEGLITGYKLITREQYDHLFHDIIGTEVKELFPGANYVGGSPEAGDEHNWWVWHVGADFEHYRQSHGWMTEFGFQSFPVPATVHGYAAASDCDSVLSEINRFHQKNGNGKGNEMILDKLKVYFRPAKDFDSTLWLSQILQSYGMNIGIEHWRTDWPQSSGSLVWQYDDCWPGPSWASVDYYGRWKAAQYGYRHAFAPVMIAGLADPKQNTVQVKIASDLMHPVRAHIEWWLCDLEGKIRVQGASDLDLPGSTSACNGPLLRLGGELQQLGREHALLRLKVTTGGQSDSNVVFFTRPKDLDLIAPRIATRVTAAKGGYDVTLTAGAPALWAWVDCADADARYSDNFVALFPGEPVTIHVTPSPLHHIKNLDTTIQVRSLYDTYNSPK
jgi:beta-mannosidase